MSQRAIVLVHSLLRLSLCIKSMRQLAGLLPKRKKYCTFAVKLGNYARLCALAGIPLINPETQTR